jgi:hypothetical protein
MLFAALGVYLVLIVLTAVGLYRLWVRHLGGAVVDWLLLPATFVSEGAYSLGRVITGRPAYGGLISPQNASSDPCRNAISGRFGLLVSMLASLLTMLACGICLLLAVHFLGGDIVRDMVTVHLLSCLDLTAIPQEVPTNWADLWEQLQYQVIIIQRITTCWMDQDWLIWQTPVFVYLAGAFSVRLAAVRHDARATLLVAIVLALLAGGLGAMIPAVEDAIAGDLWYVLTYVWGNLLFLLAITLAVGGLMKLARLLLPGTFRDSGGEG